MTSWTFEYSHSAMETRNFLEEKEHIIQRIIYLYKEIEELLENDKYRIVIPPELHKVYPNYLKTIWNRKNDIQKSDNAVVITGETSAGKTILINKILEKRIFISENEESTSTVCKIRNSDKIKIITERGGLFKETDLTGECDLSTEAGVRKLRECLKQSTYMMPFQKINKYQSVDVGLPVPFLQGNTILVDTPGIGGSGTVTHKLMDYLPNAVSFVFVINAGNAGGMHFDRLPEILNQITRLKMDGRISFDAEDAIFLTNKWDTIRSEDDDEDEMKRERTWDLLTKRIKLAWKAVTEKNIFRMNLIEVSPKKNNSSVTEFKRFKEVLEENIRKAKSIRVRQHLRFMESFLGRLFRILSIRIQSVNKSEAEQQRLTREHQRNICKLTKDCEKIPEMTLRRLDEAIGKITQQCHKRMSTEKETILNPPKEDPLSSYRSISTYPREIHRRVVSFINDFLQSSEVLQEFEDIKEDFKSKSQKIASELFEMENDWIENITNETVEAPICIELKNTHYDLSVLEIIRLFFSFTFIVSPFSDARREATVNSIYHKYTSTIKDHLSNHLQSNHGLMFRKMVERVTKDFLPQWISSLETTLEKLEKERDDILKNQSLLEEMKERVNELQDYVDKIISLQDEYNLGTTGIF